MIEDSRVEEDSQDNIFIKSVDSFAELWLKTNRLAKDLKDAEEALKKAEPTLRELMIVGGIQKLRSRKHDLTVFIHKQLWAGWNSELRNSDKEISEKDKKIVFKAMKDAGLGKFLYTTFNTNSLSAYFRELYDEAKEDDELQARLVNEGPNCLLPKVLVGKLNINEVTQIRANRGK